MRRTWLAIAVAVIMLAVLAAAWIDGGREPVHPIIANVPVPELPK